MTDETTDLNLDEGVLRELALKEKMFKLRKKLSDELVDELEAMSVDDLHARIVRCEANLHENEQAKDRDQGLKELQTKLKEARAPYQDAKKQQTSIAQYCTCLLDMQGKL